jgi:3-hydroxymyristoyl/3-hydroxydecanoyl-(acyl carrier protein) dehydratase
MSNAAASTSLWTVPADHPVFAGHFPGTPMVPGVMLLDAVLHTIAATGVAMNRCEIRSVKFLSPAEPGETLLIEHTASPNGVIHFDIVTAHGQRRIAGGTLAPAGPAVDNPGAAA